MYNFLGQYVQIFPIKTNFLQEQSINFGLTVLANFSLRVSGHFEPKKTYKKNLKISKVFLIYIKC